MNAAQTLMAILCLGLLAGSPTAAAEPLRSLFPPIAGAAPPAGPVAPMDVCPPPPPPVIDHEDVVFYTDAANSVISSDLWRRRGELNRPIRGFSAAVAAHADAYLRAPEKSAARAACAMEWLAAWARQGAFLGKVSVWARYDTLWFGQIQSAVAYLKIKASPAASPATSSVIEAWLAEIARRALADQATPRFRGRLTNIRAWAAASAAVAAIASDDRRLLQDAADQARAILETVTTDGALPAELARGRRAFHYHVWALEPLALTILAAERNGIRLTDVNNGAFSRLAGFVIAAAADPGRIARLAGVEPEPGIRQWPRDWEIAGLEIAQAVLDRPEFEAILQPRRPVRSPFTGGDWSLALGRVAAGRSDPPR
jgi:poly(beta-D-mannuronate) lyase